MAKTNSYTLRDGLNMLAAIIATDGKVMSRKARKACREIIADMIPQLPSETAPMTESQRQQIRDYAATRFKEMHGYRTEPSVIKGAWDVTSIAP